MRRAMLLMRIVAVLMFVSDFLIGLSVGTSHGAYAEVDGYSGSRWRNTTICVHNQVKNATVRQAVYNAVVDIRNNTDLHVLNMGTSTCKGYSQVIYVRDGVYSSGWVGTTDYNGYDWGQTKTGTWTYFNRSGIVVYLNHRYSNSAYNWRHIATHELGHAVGLDHRAGYCKSVMATGCAWKDRLQSVDRATINTIYGW